MRTSAEKDGVDAGELAGIEALGVAASTDAGAVLALDCDAVLLASRDLGDYATLADITQILRSGRDCINVLAYHLPHVLELTAAPDDAVERIRGACLAGGSTFHCTGIHPEFFCNRIVGTLSGLSSEIRSISISENWDASHISAMQLVPLGFGASVEEAAANPFATAFANNYALLNLGCVAESLGVRYARTETEHTPIPAPEDLPPFPNGMTIKAGQVGRLTHRYRGYVEDVPVPFTVAVEVNWMLGRGAMRPEHIATDDYYIVTVEGRPSLRIGLDIQGSFERGEHFVVPGDATSEPGYHATVVTMLQSVPRVVAAEPGWLEMVHPVPHWAPSFADSWNARGVPAPSTST